jgi:hypothetical protein
LDGKEIQEFGLSALKLKNPKLKADKKKYFFLSSFLIHTKKKMTDLLDKETNFTIRKLFLD